MWTWCCLNVHLPISSIQLKPWEDLALPSSSQFLSSWLSTFLFTRSKWLSYLRGERRHLKHFVVYYNTEEVTDHSGRMMSLVGGSKFGKPEKENQFICSEPFARRSLFTRKLVECMGQTHKLDGLLSERDKRRVYGSAQFSRQRIGLRTRERARVSNYKIQYMTIESLAIRIFFTVWGPSGNGKTGGGI